MQKDLTQRRKDAKEEQAQAIEPGTKGACDAFPSSASDLCVFASLREVLPKITDFGLAQTIEGGQTMTQSGFLVGTPCRAVTLKKEMASFRAAWNWAAYMGLVTGSFPSKGLIYPKADEKPRFTTRTEIERRIQVSGLSAKQVDELGECL